MILVTGADGQLGRAFCRLFGSDAVGLNRSQLEITSAEQTRAVIGRLKPSVIVNCAAYTAVDKAEDEPEACFAVNRDGVDNLAAVARELDALFVQISTDYVFGKAKEADGPLLETSLPSPRGVYATSKYEGEQLAAACPRHLILRTCGLYGDVTRSGNFVQTMLRLGRQGRPLRIVNDQRCNPTSTSALAEAAFALMASGHAGTFHVVSPPPVTWYEFAEEIFKRARIDVDMVPITTQEYGARAPRPRYSVLDTSKYTQVTGRSIPSISDSLQQYLADHGQTTFT